MRYVPGRRLNTLHIEGYKSIRELRLDLGALNVLVGPNGAGKSNLVSAFGLLGSIVNGDLQLSVARAGGALTMLHGGPKETSRLLLHATFGPNQYEAALTLGAQDDFIFEQEIVYFQGDRYPRPWNQTI